MATITDTSSLDEVLKHLNITGTNPELKSLAGQKPIVVLTAQRPHKDAVMTLPTVATMPVVMPKSTNDEYEEIEALNKELEQVDIDVAELNKSLEKEVASLRLLTTQRIQLEYRSKNPSAYPTVNTSVFTNNAELFDSSLITTLNNHSQVVSGNVEEINRLLAATTILYDGQITIIEGLANKVVAVNSKKASIHTRLLTAQSNYIREMARKKQQPIYNQAPRSSEDFLDGYYRNALGLDTVGSDADYE
jgi:hypothetical protein